MIKTKKNIPSWKVLLHTIFQDGRLTPKLISVSSYCCPKVSLNQPNEFEVEIATSYCSARRGTGFRCNVACHIVLFTAPDGKVDNLKPTPMRRITEYAKRTWRWQHCPRGNNLLGLAAKDNVKQYLGFWFWIRWGKFTLPCTFHWMHLSKLTECKEQPFEHYEKWTVAGRIDQNWRYHQTGSEFTTFFLFIL